MSRNETIYLKDYTPPPYRVERVALRFELDPETTRVTANLKLHNNPHVVGTGELELYGQEMALESIRLDGRELGAGDYQLDDESLRLSGLPAEFELELVTLIHPSANTALEGLYTSGGNFCTQCEAEGFRKISYFPDRPDVMAKYTTHIIADKTDYPVLLSNGNCIEQGELEGGRHYAIWEDPFPKPSYLFALVAGDLKWIEDSFTTMNGREVALRLYVREHDIDKCEHAMASLKRAMRWDEETYGREYDLDIYMIVAVNDFNMGAMENKGLNVFNSRYVLASPETATDSDFYHIESVIGHEYFHNWSGNRVTCRDWFQLSLKEGFTVLRDQQFSADMHSAAVKRIDDVSVLRAHQFQEDAGPMAHPVRPPSYEEINNFYTLTVYNKGAEVVRMLHTLLGAETFRKGTDLYFKRHDGQAVTTDDFVRAMQDVSGRDLGQFKRWYSQAGTPVVKVSRAYDAAEKSYTLSFRQSCPPTPEQDKKAPFHIPVKMALLDAEGQALPLQIEGDIEAQRHERVLELTEAEQSFTFINMEAEPVPSLLRGFSAPIKLELDWKDEELAFLLAKDGDEFNRWEAGQQLAVRSLLAIIDTLEHGAAAESYSLLSEAFAQLLDDKDIDPALAAEALTLPAESYLAEFQQTVDPIAIHTARQYLRQELAQTHRERFLQRYQDLKDDGPYSIDAMSMGRRKLRNLCLAYLAETGEPCVTEHYEQAGNMTDTMAALTALVNTGAPAAEQALNGFYQRWREEPLVLDKWFALQAASPQADTLERVQTLMKHPDFTLSNPNRARSVIGSFAMRNAVNFHRLDGAGYRYLADQVLALDALNPQVAARMVTPLIQWRRYAEQRQQQMRDELERILAAPELSGDVREIVSKGLKG